MLRVPVPLKRASTIRPIWAGVSCEADAVCGGRYQLHVAAQVSQTAGDHIGQPVQTLDVTAARLDRDEFLQRLEKRRALLFHACEQWIGGLAAHTNRQKNQPDSGQ